MRKIAEDIIKKYRPIIGDSDEVFVENLLPLLFSFEGRPSKNSINIVFAKKSDNAVFIFFQEKLVRVRQIKEPMKIEIINDLSEEATNRQLKHIIKEHLNETNGKKAKFQLFIEGENFNLIKAE